MASTTSPAIPRITLADASGLIFPATPPIINPIPIAVSAVVIFLVTCALGGLMYGNSKRGHVFREDIFDCESEDELNDSVEEAPVVDSTMMTVADSLAEVPPIQAHVSLPQESQSRAPQTQILQSQTPQTQIPQSQTPHDHGLRNQGLQAQQPQNQRPPTPTPSPVEALQTRGPQPQEPQPHVLRVHQPIARRPFEIPPDSIAPSTVFPDDSASNIGHMRRYFAGQGLLHPGLPDSHLRTQENSHQTLLSPDNASEKSENLGYGDLGSDTNSHSWDSQPDWKKRRTGDNY